MAENVASPRWRGPTAAQRLLLLKSAALAGVFALIASTAGTDLEARASDSTPPPVVTIYGDPDTMQTSGPNAADEIRSNSWHLTEEVDTHILTDVGTAGSPGDESSALWFGDMYGDYFVVGIMPDTGNQISGDAGLNGRRIGYLYDGLDDRYFGTADVGTGSGASVSDVCAQSPSDKVWTVSTAPHSGADFAGYGSGAQYVISHMDLTPSFFAQPSSGLYASASADPDSDQLFEPRDVNSQVVHHSGLNECDSAPVLDIGGSNDQLIFVTQYAHAPPCGIVAPCSDNSVGPNRRNGGIAVFGSGSQLVHAQQLLNIDFTTGGGSIDLELSPREIKVSPVVPTDQQTIRFAVIYDGRKRGPLGTPRFNALQLFEFDSGSHDLQAVSNLMVPGDEATPPWLRPKVSTVEWGADGTLFVATEWGAVEHTPESTSNTGFDLEGLYALSPDAEFSVVGPGTCCEDLTPDQGHLYEIAAGAWQRISRDKSNPLQGLYCGQPNYSCLQPTRRIMSMTATQIEGKSYLLTVLFRWMASIARGRGLGWGESCDYDPLRCFRNIASSSPARCPRPEVCPPGRR